MAADFQLLAAIRLDGLRHNLELAFGTLGQRIFIETEEQGQGIAPLRILHDGDENVVSGPLPFRVGFQHVVQGGFRNQPLFILLGYGQAHVAGFPALGVLQVDEKARIGGRFIGGFDGSVLPEAEGAFFKQDAQPGHGGVLHLGSVHEFPCRAEVRLGNGVHEGADDAHGIVHGHGGGLVLGQVLLAGQRKGVQCPLLLVIALHVQVAARAAAEVERVSGRGVGPLVICADAGDAGGGKAHMARFHEFPDDAALGLRDGLLDFQGFQGVRVPVLNNLGNRLRQRLGGAEVDQGGRRGRLPADVFLGERVHGGLGRHRLARRNFRLRRGFSGGGLLLPVSQEQEDQSQAAHDQEADDEGGDGGCVFHWR